MSGIVTKQLFRKSFDVLEEYLKEEYGIAQIKPSSKNDEDFLSFNIELKNGIVLEIEGDFYHESITLSDLNKDEILFNFWKIATAFDYGDFEIFLERPDFDEKISYGIESVEIKEMETYTRSQVKQFEEFESIPTQLVNSAILD